MERYYIDFNSGIVLKNIDESRFKCSNNIGDSHNCFIRLNEEQVEYYLNNLNANIHDIWNMTIFGTTGISDEHNYHDSIDTIKNDMIRDLEEYDKSVNVNLFYVNDTGAWLDRSTRCALMNSIITTKSLGKNEMSLWLNGEKYVLGVNDLANMLCLLEDYAMECYGVTETHRANILAIESEEELVAYDYKANYPKKLEFKV